MYRYYFNDNVWNRIGFNIECIGHSQLCTMADYVLDVKPGFIKIIKSRNGSIITGSTFNTLESFEKDAELDDITHHGG